MANEKQDNRRIIHLDKDGNVIEDISKVVIPDDLSKEIFELLNPNYKAV